MRLSDKEYGIDNMKVLESESDQTVFVSTPSTTPKKEFVKANSLPTVIFHLPKTLPPVSSSFVVNSFSVVKLEKAAIHSVNQWPLTSLIQYVT